MHRRAYLRSDPKTNARKLRHLKLIWEGDCQRTADGGGSRWCIFFIRLPGKQLQIKAKFSFCLPSVLQFCSTPLPCVRACPHATFSMLSANLTSHPYARRFRRFCTLQALLGVNFVGFEGFVGGPLCECPPWISQAGPRCEATGLGAPQSLRRPGRNYQIRTRREDFEILRRLRHLSLQVLLGVNFASFEGFVGRPTCANGRPWICRLATM